MKLTTSRSNYGWIITTGGIPVFPTLWTQRTECIQRFMGMRQEKRGYPYTWQELRKKHGFDCVKVNLVECAPLPKK